MTHIDLFSGIGGFALAARWAGLQTIQFVEIDKFCQKVLQKNFPGVPIHDDITQFSGSRFTNVFLLTGGFPCQPFSCAGKRRGKEDDRYLWPEMLRVISEIKPRWVIGENVAGFIGMGLDDSISDLERTGYEVQAFIIPACAANAPHRRDRVWIVGYAKSGAERTFGRICEGQSSDTPRGIKSDSHVADSVKAERKQSVNSWAGREGFTDDCDHAPDSGNEGLQGSEETGNIGINRQKSRNEQFRGLSCWHEPWLEVATRLCRVDDGISRQVDRVNRLKALGNAIVPQVAYEIIKSVMEFAEMKS